MGNRNHPHPRRCTLQIPLLQHANLTQGILTILVVILSHFAFGGWTRPILWVGFLHFIGFAFNLAAFIVALTYPPYVDGCANSTYKWCEVEKAAIGLIGVLWYRPTHLLFPNLVIRRLTCRIFFLISTFILCVDGNAYSSRGVGNRTPGRGYSRYYY
jgi:hypothetical protein